MRGASATGTAPGPAASKSPEFAYATTRYRLTVPIVVFCAVSCLLLAVGVLASHILPDPHIDANRSGLPQSDPLSRIRTIAAPWFRFDALWYMSVVQHGYHYGTPEHANTNFMPVYPVLARAAQFLTLNSPWIALWLVAALAYAVALVLLFEWTLLFWDRQRAIAALLLNAVFPFAFFMVTPYAEPVFLALAIAAFLAAETERPAVAIACAGASTVARPVGVAVVLGLAVLYYGRRQIRLAVLSMLGFLPLLAFSAYLWIAVGHPLAFTINHSISWVPAHGGILTTIGSQFHTTLSPMDRVDAAVTVLFFISGIFVWRRLGAGYGVFVLIGVLLPFSKGLVSMERYVTVLFPAIALWAAGAGKIGRLILFAVSLLGLVLFTAMFASGYSVF